MLPIRHLLRFLLAAALLPLTGCGGSDDAEAGGPAGEDPSTSYFAPRSGEIWKYKVQKEIPIELRLSETDAARRPQKTESAHLITFEQVRTCMGERQVGDVDRELTAIAISEDDHILGEELYSIGPEGVLSWGWLPAGVPDDQADLLSEGVPIATSNMQPGQVWESVGTDPANPFLFRVIERGKVTVPAGTFEAARIQITSEKISPHPVTGEDHITYLKRTIWFAEDAGVVKEEIVYYGDHRVRVKQRSELMHWIQPSDDVAPEQSAVVSTGDPAPPGDREVETEAELEPEGEAEAEADSSTEPEGGEPGESESEEGGPSGNPITDLDFPEKDVAREGAEEAD